MQTLQITINDDGFTLVDPDNSVSIGTPLRVQYELPSGWRTKDCDFELTHSPSLFHPFRKNGMFIYTGETPIRVVVQPRPTANWGTKFRRDDFNAQSYYANRNFAAYPYYTDSIWDDDYLPFCLGAFVSDSNIDPGFVPGGGTFGGGGATSDFVVDSVQPHQDDDSNMSIPAAIIDDAAAPVILENPEAAESSARVDSEPLEPNAY